MKRLGGYFRNLTLQHWGWLQFKFGLGIFFPVLTLIGLPASVEHSVSRFLVLAWLGLAVAGALLSMVGIIMSAQGGKTAVLALSVELIGLLFMFLGPFLLFLMYCYFAFTGKEVRLVAIGLTWALCSAVLARALMVIPRFVREARDETKEL